MKSIIFWQWANQSINVAINYSNANKTTVMNFQETACMFLFLQFPYSVFLFALGRGIYPFPFLLAVAYVSAVTTSCIIAVGLTQAVPRLRSVSPAVKSLLMKLVPFAAVASAGTVNVFLMRLKEIRYVGAILGYSEGKCVCRIWCYERHLSALASSQGNICHCNWSDESDFCWII